MSLLLCVVDPNDAIAWYRMFGTTEPCDNIHSQSKRMVMLSPEHNFWMHAVSAARDHVPPALVDLLGC